MLSRDGRILPIEVIERRQFSGKVYNISVADLECYAVGRNSVLVHNKAAGVIPGWGCDCCEGAGLDDPSVAASLDPPGAFGPLGPGYPSGYGEGGFGAGGEFFGGDGRRPSRECRRRRQNLYPQQIHRSHHRQIIRLGGGSG